MLKDKKSKDTSDMTKVKKSKYNVDELEQKLGEYMQGWQRAQADYQNLQKETQKWKVEFAQYAKADFIQELLPVYGHYKTALEHIPNDDKNKDWVRGIQHIFQQLKTLLDKFNVKEIKTIGEEFDHNIHDAVGHGNDKSKEDDIILTEIQPGYMIDDRMLQPAKVIINKKDIKSEVGVKAVTEDK